MSRPLRIEYPNAWHHVMNRARRGQMLFVDKDDYTCFLDQYQWSSHKGYVSKAKKWNWLHKGFILSMLTSQKSQQIKQKLQKDKKFKKRIEKIVELYYYRVI